MSKGSCFNQALHVRSLWGSAPSPPELENSVPRQKTFERVTRSFWGPCKAFGCSSASLRTVVVLSAVCCIALLLQPLLSTVHQNRRLVCLRVELDVLLVNATGPITLTCPQPVLCLRSALTALGRTCEFFYRLKNALSQSRGCLKRQICCMH